MKYSYRPYAIFYTELVLLKIRIYSIHKRVLSTILFVVLNEFSHGLLRHD
ncbi:hypothetical protein GCM10023314_00800 [Algibacter agarivorans]|uniref:Uncharacterized protein n=1 Tax=Algibacter agarivorans TaxID=1109741 RepID=A0ABP9G8K7_9FLAO